MSDISPQAVKDVYARITAELGKIMVGQETIIRLLLVSLFARGHCLLIGVPGLAKTLLVRSLAETLTLTFKRIQFTPDLMPSDIIGSELLQERDRKLEFEYFAGPIFANLLLADEVNRTPPKTQSALLEAMQEHKVTVAGASRALPDPFLVVATQNPIEQEGTYPLPEAQLDRFMFSLHLDYPAHEEEVEIVRRTTLRVAEQLAAVVTLDQILAAQQLVLAAPVSDHVIDYAVRLAESTRPSNAQAPQITRDFVEWGAGPRASQYLILGAKALALLAGKIAAETADVRDVALPVLQHRVITNYRATGAGEKVAGYHHWTSFASAGEELLAHSWMQPPPLPKQSTVSAAAASLLKLRQQARQAPPPLLLNLQELERFENLMVFAKAIVEGYYAGKHKSPYRGSAAEFADYKEYAPGDDLARLDWRVYGRTRRLYLRQFEEETDMTAYLMLDTSGSMRYAGGERQSKFFLAAKIAAALAYLMMAQSDKAALVLFAQKVTQFLAPGGTRRHLHRLVTELERVRPALTTGIAGAVQECTALFKKRGRIVILSDFLDDTDALFDALAQFVHRKFEILLLQIIDPDELNLPAFNAAKFVDLETAETVQVDPEEIRASYQANIQRHIDALACEADLRQIQHRLVDTQRPYLDAIEAYLGFRGKNESS